MTAGPVLSETSRFWFGAVPTSWAVKFWSDGRGICQFHPFVYFRIRGLRAMEAVVETWAAVVFVTSKVSSTSLASKAIRVPESTLSPDAVSASRWIW